MKFSVLLPTKNRLDLLSYAIETVRAQDYSDWEIIVSDNVSEEDIGGYITSLNDQRVKYYRTEKFVPVTDNWNNALEKSDGDYVIMLGDDDCLMQGYFSTLKKEIEKYDSPDFVYTSAYLYAYPGVLPNLPKGFLRSYNKRRIFQSSQSSFWLEKSRAEGFAKDSLSFRATFDYNMQFSLVSRKLINELCQYGQFYQSPYPDYYASNAMMLMAKRILVVPQPLVTIGISPKSFGFYYFNDAETNGNMFLNNIPDQNMVERLKKVILPGTAMNTSWLISMETLVENFGNELDIKVNYARYRHIQIFSIYAGLLADTNVGESYQRLWYKLSLTEKLTYALIFSIIAKITPKRLRRLMSRLILRASGSHPGTVMPKVNNDFKNILDVFNCVSFDIRT